MDKTAKIKSRRSIRRYLGKPIPANVLSDVLECARLSPTARNIQPWFFVVVTDREKLTSLGALADHGGFIADAAACFAVFCMRGEKYFLEDGCAATMNIIYALGSYGIGSCWVAGDKKAYAEEVRAVLGIGDDYTLVSLIPAGYPQGEQKMPGKKGVSEVSVRL